VCTKKNQQQRRPLAPLVAALEWARFLPSYAMLASVSTFRPACSRRHTPRSHDDFFLQEHADSSFIPLCGHFHLGSFHKQTHQLVRCCQLEQGHPQCGPRDRHRRAQLHAPPQVCSCLPEVIRQQVALASAGRPTVSLPFHFPSNIRAWRRGGSKLSHLPFAEIIFIFYGRIEAGQVAAAALDKKKVQEILLISW